VEGGGGDKKRRRGEEGGGRGEEGGEEKRAVELHSSQIPPCLFPRKKFLFFTPGLFVFSKCALLPPLSQ
jgi:hypothetical protein